MKFAKIDVPLLRKAIRIYLTHAFSEDWKESDLRVPFKIKGGDSVRDLLQQFRDESVAGEGDKKKVHRFILQLGNVRYPFMKFVLQDHLILGEYFFAVDTHDSLNMKPSYPDFDKWMGIKEYNRSLKLEVERAWRDAGIPTALSLKELAGEVCAWDPRKARGCILLVDDERDIAEFVCQLLEGEGYRVEIVGTGEEALEKLEETRPDLILTDYEMPGMDGLELCKQVRAHPTLGKTSILLATAGSMDLSNLTLVDGFMVKPYQKEVLFSFVQHLIGSTGRSKQSFEEP